MSKNRNSDESPIFLSEREWSKLIRSIHHGQVVPVIGPELITLSESEVLEEPTTLQAHIAEKLAGRLEMPMPTGGAVAINDVVRDYLMNGGVRKDVYDEVRELLDDLDVPPSPALRSLARIKGFDFLISGTFDHQLARALELERVDFSITEHLSDFHPSKPIDLPRQKSSTHLFHILGDYNTYPDFALWEEDYMEYICGLLENRDILSELFSLLKNRTLLFLGAPTSDWLVRFLLRAVRQERLSGRGDDKAGEYLAESYQIMEEPLVFYFDKLVNMTHVFDGSPIAFVEELSRRWEERHGQSSSGEDFLQKLPESMPDGSVFISYAKEDLSVALAIAQELDSANVPVWLDRGRLQAGENYETSLEAAVRVQCSFFISLISDATEADVDRSRYVHKERDWAAGRHMDGYVFYIPTVIRSDVNARPTAEPEIFSKIHEHKLSNGVATPEFVRRIRALVEANRISGRPRG